jgi:hypothetical protein
MQLSGLIRILEASLDDDDDNEVLFDFALTTLEFNDITYDPRNEQFTIHLTKEEY